VYSACTAPHYCCTARTADSVLITANGSTVSGSGGGGGGGGGGSCYCGSISLTHNRALSRVNTRH